MALSVVFVLMLMRPTATLAQQNEEEPSEEQPAQALPTIAPQEIEILGTLEIGLPSLERQPLTGFNPPPRIPAPSTDRTPYLGDYEQDRSDLPQDLPAPPPIESTLEQPAPPLNGELEAGGGRYFTRHAEGRLWAPLSPTESFTVEATYRGTNGHEPFDDDPSIETPHDTFEGTLGLQSQRDAFIARAQIGGFFDTYTLYGTQTGGSSLSGTPLDQPDREGRGGSAEVMLSTYTRMPVTLTAAFERSDYETTYLETAPDGILEAARDENRFSIGGTADLPLIYPTTIDANFSWFSVGSSSQTIYDAWHLDGGGESTVYETGATSLAIGARLLTNDLSPSGTPADSATDQSSTYVTPTFDAEWQSPTGASLYLRNTPGIDANALGRLFQDNPYLVFEPVTQPTIRTTDVEAGVRYYTGRLQLAAHGGYAYSPNFQFFESTAQAPYTRGLFDARYASARIISAGAEASLQRLNGIDLVLGLTYRNGQLTDTDAAIPHFAPITGRAVFSYAFDDQRGHLQLVGHFESPRYLDRSETTETDAYFDLDFKAAYDLTESLGLTFQVQNMSPSTTERWPRYERPPLALSAGMRVRW